MQYVDVGHKKHLEHCSGSRKRNQQATIGHVEIEGLDELEAEEERMHDDEEHADTRPPKVCHHSYLLCVLALCYSPHMAHGLSTALHAVTRVSCKRLRPSTASS